MTDRIIKKGKWGEDIDWTFYESNQVYKPELCTAVYCYAFVDDKVIVVKVKRGWDIVGGHIESGESVEETLIRETKEEGGADLERFDILGYKKLISKKKIKRRDSDDFYPFPESNAHYFIGKVKKPLQEPSGHEILSVDLLNYQELQDLNIISSEITDLAFKLAKDNKSYF